jgi:hypothetical protein
VKNFNANNIDLSHHYPEAFQYVPLNLRVWAFMVTDDNIGSLAVDFESEVKCEINQPSQINVRVERKIGDADASELRFFEVGDWLVLLRGEIHKFKDQHFRTTFASYPRLGDVVTPEVAQQDVELDKMMVVVKESGAIGKVLMVESGPRGRRYQVQFDEGDGWFSKEELAPAPTPHPRSKEVEETKPAFRMGAKVDTGDGEEHVGVIVEGPNKREEYFIKYDKGGADWVHAGLIRLIPPKEKTS